MRRVVLCSLAVLACAAPAHATLSGTPAPPPAGCTPLVTIAQAIGLSSPVCIHRVLVTETNNASGQNATTFTVTDHDNDLPVRIRNWWPQGAPQAGMVLTLWGQMEGGTFRVDRYVDLTHGTGPAPAGGPYPVVSQLDVDSGKVPLNRTVWVPSITFLLDPQDSGDGDTHVQTLWPCPAAGLTSESTPVMRGYVDHPAIPGLTSTTDTSDGPSRHLADDPPVGVPVMILGSLRVDYGFGWYELHPIRAWRPMTAAELAAAQQGCSDDPVMHFDNGPTYGGTQVPVPFGVPPCTDGSEFGNAPGFGVCTTPYCYVTHTDLVGPEQVAGACAGVVPRLTPSQEGLPERLPGDGLGALPPAALTRAVDADLGAERERFRHARSPLTAAYGPGCRGAGLRGAQVARCADAVAHLASGEAISAWGACRRVAAPARSRCARAAQLAARRLGALRAVR